MAASLLTPNIIAKEGLMLLENNLVAAKSVYRAYEGEFTSAKIGDTLSIRKPVRWTSGTGATISVQDPAEGKVQIKVDTQRHIAFRFRSDDLTLKIEDFSNRYMKSAMIELASKIDADILSTMYKGVWNYVVKGGTLDDTKRIGSWADFAVGPQRLEEMAVPKPYTGIVSPNDKYGIVGSIVSLQQQSMVQSAFERAKLPMTGDVDVLSTQTVASHTRGTCAGSPVISPAATNGQVMSSTYANVKDTNQQTSKMTGATGSTTLKAGDVFTIASVYAINPVTKAKLPYLQQFVVIDDVIMDATSTNHTDVKFSPAIIPADTAGPADLPYATVSTTPADSAVVTVLGTANKIYPQNLVFNENAIALCMVPMEMPQGNQKASRQSHKGFSVRVITDYDIINDVNTWRLDFLYGLKLIYPDLATRLGGYT
jgi:hypothetical protein